MLSEYARRGSDENGKVGLIAMLGPKLGDGLPRWLMPEGKESLTDVAGMESNETIG